MVNPQPCCVNKVWWSKELQSLVVLGWVGEAVELEKTKIKIGPSSVCADPLEGIDYRGSRAGPTIGVFI